MIYIDNLIQPIWKNINNVLDIIDGMYTISSFGNIMNIKSGIILKAKYINSGYLIYTLRCKDRKYGHFTVHRLVKIVFDPVYNMKQLQVNHKDGNKLNNYYYNLEWCTQNENMQHATRNHLIPLGEECYNSIFSNDQVHLICRLLENGLSYKEILNTINIPDTDNNRDYIGNIKRRKTYKSISCNYHF